MSSAAMHLSREVRKLCERCWQRKALFQHRGVVRPIAITGSASSAFAPSASGARHVCSPRARCSAERS